MKSLLKLISLKFKQHLTREKRDIDIEKVVKTSEL